MSAHLPTSAERGGSPKGCWKGPGFMSYLEETFLSVAAEGIFAIGTFPYFVLCSYLGSFFTLALGITDLLCPGGD